MLVDEFSQGRLANFAAAVVGLGTMVGFIWNVFFL